MKFSYLTPTIQASYRLLSLLGLAATFLSPSGANAQPPYSRTSGEYLATAEYITALGRVPDPGGWQYWSGVLNEGLSLDTVSQVFLGCTEYSMKYGSPSDSDFVTLVCQNAYNRMPTPTDSSTYSNGQITGQETLRSLYVDTVVNSDEFNRDYGNVATTYCTGSAVPTPGPFPATSINAETGLVSFTVNYTNNTCDNPADISWGQIWIASTGDTSNNTQTNGGLAGACFVQWDSAGNIYLYDYANGGGYQSGKAGAIQTLTSTNCYIELSGSSVEMNGSVLAVQLDAAFTNNFVGEHAVWAISYSPSLASPWTNLSWTYGNPPHGNGGEGQLNVIAATQPGTTFNGTAIIGPNNGYTGNYAPAVVYDAGVYRVWWTCYKSGSPGICYGDTSSGSFQYKGVAITAGQFGLCDIADPSVVRLNNTWYLFADAIANGLCTPGGGVKPSGNIWAFWTSNPTNWPTGNAAAVIGPCWSNPSGCSGTASAVQPSAIVMNYGYSCVGDHWQATPTTPFVRVYYTWNDSSGNPPMQPHSGYMFASDSPNPGSAQFTQHCTCTTGASECPSDQETCLVPWTGFGVNYGGYEPSVKKVGLSGLGLGDYPLVMTYFGGETVGYYSSGPFAAVTGGAPSDFSWTGWGDALHSDPAALPLNPLGTTAYLESTPDGTLVDAATHQAFSDGHAGSLNFWWVSRQNSNNNPIYNLSSGSYASSATYFPWPTTFGGCNAGAP